MKNKKKCTITFLLSILLSISGAYAQSYTKLKVNLVQSFYDSACSETIHAGNKILIKHPDKATAEDYYLLARCYARTGDVTNTFSILNKALDKGFTQLIRIKQYNDFKLLQNTEDWNELMKRVVRLKQEKEKRIQYPDIANQLKEMNDKDQTIRAKVFELFKSGVTQIPDSLLKPMQKIDSLNLEAYKKIVSQIGWPGISLVGEEGNRTAFLLAQHADGDTALQSYFLKLLQQSVRDKDADAKHLALLEDRVLRNQNKPQKYGTQAWISPVTKKLEIEPMEDEINVDVRRILIGLPPLKVYKREMGIDK